MPTADVDVDRMLAVLDRCVTAMGSRLLADWVANPLCEPAAIDARLDAVEELVQSSALGDQLHDALRGVYDMERLLARVTTLRASPRDLKFVGRSQSGHWSACSASGSRRFGSLSLIDTMVSIISFN